MAKLASCTIPSDGVYSTSWQDYGQQAVPVSEVRGIVPETTVHWIDGELVAPHFVKPVEKMERS